MQDLSRFSKWVRYRAVPIVAVAALGTIVAAMLASQARIDVNPLNLQDPNTEPVQLYQELARDPATSPYEVNVTATTLKAARAISPVSSAAWPKK